jgi:hypothetical protein
MIIIVMRAARLVQPSMRSHPFRSVSKVEPRRRTVPATARAGNRSCRQPLVPATARAGGRQVERAEVVVGDGEQVQQMEVGEMQTGQMETE